MNTASRAGLVLPAIFCAAISSALAADKLALVVGNNEYHSGELATLQSAIADAQLIGRTLRDLGFEVDVLKNADRDSITAAIKAMSEAANAGDTTFFYFAGHGAQISGETVIFAADITDLSNARAALIEGIPVSGIVNSAVSETGNHIVVLDTSRSNPWPDEKLDTHSASTDPGDSNLVVLYAAEEGGEAYDSYPGDDLSTNSPFADALAKALAVKGRSLVDSLRDTMDTLVTEAQAAGIDQVPNLYFEGSTVEDFTLAE